LKKIQPRIALVPLYAIVGTLLGTFMIAFVLPGLNVYSAMGIGSGLGYYSLSSAIVAKMASPELGVTTLLANVLREISTLFLAPHLFRWFGPLATIVSGGATSMDTTLPSTTLYSGKGYAFIAIFN